MEMKKQRRHGDEGRPTLEELHGDIGKIPVPLPSAKMDKRFRMMLDEEKKKDLIGGSISARKTSFYQQFSNPVWKIAAGIALFLMGWLGASWFGNGTPDKQQLASLNGEVVKLRETLVLAMIEQTSPVERIKAVSMMNQMEQADGKIIQSLLSTLENDENDNVRLIALDALTKYANQPAVREGLINAISRQTSPMVQLRLAEIMVSLQEKRSVPEFEKILNNANLNYSVRNKLDETVKILI
jgi:hypothetical protein